MLRDGVKTDISNAHILHNFKAGDIVMSLGGGGAGVGLPEERDPEAVKMDVKNEIISFKAARDLYKVVLDAETLEIDYPATQKLRTKARENG